MNNRRSGKRKIIFAVIIALVAILLFWLVLRFIVNRGILDEGIGDTGGWGKDDSEEAVLMFGDTDYVTSDDFDTYLMIGTDAGGEDVDGSHNGQLADFLALLIVDNTTEKFGIIQIDRNTMVDMGELGGYDDDGEGVKQQICLAHWYGENDGQRNDNTVYAVSQLFGYLDIDNYYAINMSDMGRINNAIGGVTVDIETDMTEVDPDFVEGTSVLLTDEQAEKFVRARMNVGGGTNKERMSRQTQYMQRAYDQVMDQLGENPEYVNDLYDSLQDIIESEEKGANLSRMVNHVMQYENLGIMQIDGTVSIADTQDDGVEHEEFYADTDSIIETLSRIIDLKKMEE